MTDFVLLWLVLVAGTFAYGCGAWFAQRRGWHPIPVAGLGLCAGICLFLTVRLVWLKVTGMI